MPNILRSATGSEPAYNAVAITPADGTDVSAPVRAIYVGGTGNISLMMPDASIVVFYNVPSGAVLPVRALRVRATGTTATNLVGMW